MVLVEETVVRNRFPRPNAAYLQLSDDERTAFDSRSVHRPPPA